MFRTLAASLAVIALLSMPAHAEEAQTLYRNATLIDGSGGAPRSGMDILVTGERITRVWSDSDASAPAPKAARVVDATGQFVLPGLINTHEHLATPPNRPFAEAQMKRDLYGGITAVRDMADDLRQIADLARASRVGELVGPDIYYAALMAGPEFFHDPRTHAVTQGAVAGATPWMQAIGPDTDLVQAVALARGTGATAIKIYADLPGERVRAITAEAHRQGIQVWAHAAVFPATPAEVVAAGADVVSHVCMLAYQVSDPMPRAYHNRAPVEAAKFGPGDSPAMANLFAALKAGRQPLDATLFVYEGLDRRYAADPKGPPPYCTLDLAARLTAQARRAGVIVTAGTDGFSEASDPFPGLYRELELLVDRAGFTPLQAIRAATGDAALAVGHDPDFGVIQAGKLANLVFTTQDPSREIRALRSIVLTVKRGRPFPRAEFQPDADRPVRKDD